MSAITHVCGALAFARTNIFKDVPQLSRRVMVQLPCPTDDTMPAQSALASSGYSSQAYRYKKRCTMLMELQPKAQRQVTLFEDSAAIARRDRLNQAMNRINSHYGQRMVSL